MINLRSASLSCKIAAVAGLFYLIAAIAFAAIPETLSIIDWKSTGGLYRIAAVDLAIGSALIWAAPSSRAPTGLNILGAMALLGAVFYSLVPVQFIAPQLDWWLVEQRTLTRIMSIVFGLPIGAFILFATLSSPDKKE